MTQFSKKNHKNLKEANRTGLSIMKCPLLHTLREKCTGYLSVFSLNAGKYGPHFDAFHAVIFITFSLKSWQNMLFSIYCSKKCYVEEISRYGSNERETEQSKNT